MLFIVDDDAAMSETCAMLLGDQGFVGTVASNGAVALASTALLPPELLITDYSTPGKTGVELSLRNRANAFAAHLPVLLTIGSLRREIAPEPDYDAFLRKPFLAENSHQKCESWCAPQPYPQSPATADASPQKRTKLNRSLPVRDINSQ